MIKGERKRNEEHNHEIEELQIIEQNLQSLIMQKQVFQMELIETENALEELKKTTGDVFKIIGSLMIKAKKPELEKELIKKKELLELRLKSIDKQEKELREKSEHIRKELMEKAE